MPGFIAFPLSGILLSKGVPYMVISAFTTTLMIVGVLSYPVEKAYFGTKVTIMRNVVKRGQNYLLEHDSHAQQINDPFSM